MLKQMHYQNGLLIFKNLVRAILNFVSIGMKIFLIDLEAGVIGIFI